LVLERVKHVIRQWEDGDRVKLAGTTREGEREGGREGGREKEREGGRGGEEWRGTTCKDCGGSSICEHQRVRNKCKDCGGSSICEH